VKVASGTGSVRNIPTVSVTICAPGTSTCQTIDNIQVDTMSFGLRLVNTAAASVLGSLSIETDSSGNQIAECTQFADGYTWGSVRKADVTIGGETASNIPVAIIGDMSSSTIPSGCSSLGSAENTVSALGANGILGIGVATYDCGATCVSSIPSTPMYYACSGGTSCGSGTTLALAQQVINPVVKFSSDNNGVVLAMPSVGTTGSSTASGTLTFGIGTQSNNTLSASQQFGTTGTGLVNSTFSSTSGVAFFDSGSNGYFIGDSTLTACSGTYAGWYCPSSATTRSVAITNASGSVATGTVTLSIYNASTLFGSGNYALNDLAGDIGSTTVQDLGMPFFYGRTVYFGYDLTSSSRGAGTGTQTPYIAF